VSISSILSPAENHRRTTERVVSLSRFSVNEVYNLGETRDVAQQDGP